MGALRPGRSHPTGGRAHRPRTPSRDLLVPVGFSQASAELRSEKGTDAGSPQKSSAMSTKHAKVRGQDPSDSRQLRGLALRARCPLSGPANVSMTQLLGRWGLALCPSLNLPAWGWW